jgi:hypothetical protein
MAIYKKIPHIKNDVLIDFKVSGAFLKQLQIGLISLANDQPQEEVLKYLERYRKNESAETVNELCIHIFTALIGDIEQAAMEQNKVEYQDIDTDNIKLNES